MSSPLIGLYFIILEQSDVKTSIRHRLHNLRHFLDVVSKIYEQALSQIRGKKRTGQHQYFLLIIDMLSIKRLPRQ